MSNWDHCIYCECTSITVSGHEEHQKFAAINAGGNIVLRPCFAFISPASRAAKLSPEPCFRRRTQTGWTFNETVTSSGPSMAVKYGRGSVHTKRDET